MSFFIEIYIIAITFPCVWAIFNAPFNSMANISARPRDGVPSTSADMACHFWLQVAGLRLSNSLVMQTKMNEYELARDRRVAYNKARLAELGLCSLVSQFEDKHFAKPRQSRTRAPRLKGAEPTRRSERSSKAAHTVLNELVLSGETLPEPPRYRLCRKRFETESMPSKRKAQHEFDGSFDFRNDATQSAAEEWYSILRLQPELSAPDWEATCEQLAFNLGQEGLTKNSLAGGTDETAKIIYDTALYDIENPTLGTQIALKRVLQNLRTGGH